VGLSASRLRLGKGSLHGQIGCCNQDDSDQ
jgi:hypothetical protein